MTPSISRPQKKRGGQHLLLFFSWISGTRKQAGALPPSPGLPSATWIESHILYGLCIHLLPLVRVTNRTTCRGVKPAVAEILWLAEHGACQFKPYPSQLMLARRSFSHAYRAGAGVVPLHTHRCPQQCCMAMDYPRHRLYSCPISTGAAYWTGVSHCPLTVSISIHSALILLYD